MSETNPLSASVVAKLGEQICLAVSDDTWVSNDYYLQFRVKISEIMDY